MTQFETGAKTEKANNFILSFDCYRENNEALKEIQYKIWKQRENMTDKKRAYFFTLLIDLVNRVNGKLENVPTLQTTQRADVIGIYFEEALQTIENDLV